MNLLNPEQLSAAADAFLFQQIAKADLAALFACSGVSLEAYAQGGCIRSHETPVGCLGILLSGSATVEKYCNGEHMLMSILQRGDLFGAAAMFGAPDHYVADITAREATVALNISESALKEMMQRDFRITENYLRYLTGRIRFLTKRIDSFAQPSAEERVLLFLYNNADSGVFDPEYPLSTLAEALCIGRASLYRALDALEAKGQIQRNKRKILLLNNIERMENK